MKTLGNMIRRRLQEEAAAKHERCNGRFFEESEVLKDLRTNALAVDDGNFRIDGKRPHVLFEECSLHELAAETILKDGKPVGHEFISWAFAPNDRSRDNFARTLRMREAGETGAVDYTMFAGITGQLLINSTLTGWEHEEFKFSRTAGVYNTQFVDGERVPGVSEPYTDDTSPTGSGEDLLLVKPQQSFPMLTMGENYIQLPPTELRGAIMGVDRLAIYGDRTGLVAANAAKGSKILARRKEQRGLDMLIGWKGAAYQEKYLWDTGGAVTLDPYQYSAAGSGANQLAFAHASRKFPFYNDIPANYITDYHAFEKADQAESKLVDPNDGQPLESNMSEIFIPFTERFQVAEIMKAYSQWVVGAVAITSASAMATSTPNVIEEMMGKLTVTTSKMLRQEMVRSGLYGDATALGGTGANCDRVWFRGNFKEAIKYSTNWNIKVIMAPVNSEAEFTQDIVLRWRFDERGAWGWHNPRLVQRQNYQNPN